MNQTLRRRALGVRWTVVAALVLSTWGWSKTRGGPEPTTIDGRELFTREWLPGDSRARGGDGLGPVFNDSSCAACHNQGGVGGAGPSEKNVDIITAFKAEEEVSFSASVREQRPKERRLETEVAPVDEERRREAVEERKRLGAIHPGFLTQRSVVLHHFAVDPGYAQWRARFGSGPESSNQQIALGFDELQRRRAEALLRGFPPMRSEIDGFAFQRSQRNPTPLFGAGLIDTIPESALLEAAGRRRKGFPEVTGRVSRLEGGRVGRFGWKAQESTLDGFVRTACAVELGLHVPGRPQSGLPAKPEQRAAGYDLREDEVAALVSYLAHLPRPVERRPSGGPEWMVEEGEAHFRDIGCASCHFPALGEVKGIYSDLLLHDMGRELGDQGAYGSFSPDLSDANRLDEPLPTLVGSQRVAMRVEREVHLTEEGDPARIGSGPSEWRTPPLWGVRDSAPYLHDGRAGNLDQAIALHGGEGESSARRYFKLPHEDRLALQGFLKSLVAP